MITILNRYELFADSSAEAAANVREKLRQNGISYEMRTVQNSFSVFKDFNALKFIIFGGMYEII